VTSPSSFNTVGRAIQKAYEETQLIAKGTRPNSEQIASAMNDFNAMVNQWQTEGLKLWLEQDLSMVLVAGTSLYPIGPGAAGISMTKPLRIPMGYYLDPNGSRVPMTPMSRQEITILQPIATGQPVNYFVDKQAYILNVTLWPTPDAAAALGTAHLITQTQATNVTMLTDQTAFPIEWFQALAWGLADEICGGQPQAIVQRCAERAARFKAALVDWDVEDAQTFFTPDTRGGSRGWY
jgi:hypothetical protein